MHRRAILGLMALAGGPRVRVTTSAAAPFVGELERLVEDLLFPSESDAPISVVFWPRPGVRPSARRLAALVGEPHPEIVAELAARELWRGPATARPWHDVEERILTSRFAAIGRFFDDHLRDARAFRFGRLTLRTYAVGVTAGGDWLGLMTTELDT